MKDLSNRFFQDTVEKFFRKILIQFCSKCHSKLNLIFSLSSVLRRKYQVNERLPQKWCWKLFVAVLWKLCVCNFQPSNLQKAYRVSSIFILKIVEIVSLYQSWFNIRQN